MWCKKGKPLKKMDLFCFFKNNFHFQPEIILSTYLFFMLQYIDFIYMHAPFVRNAGSPSQQCNLYKSLGKILLTVYVHVFIKGFAT